MRRQCVRGQALPIRGSAQRTSGYAGHRCRCRIAAEVFKVVPLTNMSAADLLVVIAVYSYCERPEGPGGGSILHHHPREDPLARRARRVINVSIALNCPLDVH